MDTSTLRIIIAAAPLLAAIAWIIVVVAGIRLYWKHRNEGGGKVITAFFILAAGLFLPQFPVETMPTIPRGKSLHASELGYFTTIGYVAWSLAGPAFAICCYFLAARLLKRGPGEPVIPDSPSSFESRLATFYFKRTPEGLVFTFPPFWVFGRGRAYRVSDAQAGQLMARIRRVHFPGIPLVVVAGLIVAVTVVAVMMPVTPERLFVEHPIAAFSAGVMFGILLVGLFRAMLYRAARPVLTRVSCTSAPREPYSLVGNLKKSAVLTSTPALVIVGVVIGLTALPTSGIKAYKALASGQVNIDVLIAPGLLLMLVAVGAELVKRVKAQPSAK